MFSEGDLVWKMVLPMEKKSHVYRKWSPTWDGPYWIDKVYSRNTYKIVNIGIHQRIPLINGKYLKVYRLNIHEIKVQV